MTPTIEHCKLWFADPTNARKFFGNFTLMENGCQLWLGPFFESKHGRYKFDGSDVRVHRLRWIWRRGVDLPEGIFIRHAICHNRACSNPAHLIGGTWQDNRDDQMFLDGPRMAFGPGHETGGEPGTVEGTRTRQ